MMETNAARVELKAAWGGDVEVSVAVLDRHISVDLGAEVVCEVQQTSTIQRSLQSIWIIV